MTIRQELARRLKAYYNVYRKFPDSYNGNLGIGKIPKCEDRGFTGESIDGKYYIVGKVFKR